MTRPQHDPQDNECIRWGGTASVGRCDFCRSMSPQRRWEVEDEYGGNLFATVVMAVLIVTFVAVVLWLATR